MSGLSKFKLHSTYHLLLMLMASDTEIVGNNLSLIVYNWISLVGVRIIGTVINVLAQLIALLCDRLLVVWVLTY